MANDNLSEIIRRILHLETKVKRIENSSDNADLAKRVGVLEKAFATKPAAPAVKISTTTKPAPGNMIAKSADIQALRLASIEREVSSLLSKLHKAGIYTDTYYDDLQYQMVGQKLTSPSAHITYNATNTLVRFAKTCDWNDDWLAMTIQMSHRWKTGTVVYPHIHWQQTAAAMPNFGISWLWETNGAALATSWTHVKHSANAYEWTTGTLNQITKFGTITPPTGASLSDLLLIQIWRDVANESTLFTGAEVDVNVQDNADAYSFDIHFELDSAGSNTEYVK